MAVVVVVAADDDDDDTAIRTGSNEEANWLAVEAMMVEVVWECRAG